MMTQTRKRLNIKLPLYTLGEALSKSGDPALKDQAPALYQKLIDEGGETSGLCLRVGKYYFEAGDYAWSKEVFRQGQALADQELLAEGLTEEQRRAYVLADNRLTELGGWDMDLVGQEMKELADVILKKSCKNVAFCGTASDEWQRVFDEADREINGFNDITGYEDFAVMWRFEDVESLADEVYTCWNEVLILCSNMSLIRECQNILEEA